MSEKPAKRRAPEEDDLERHDVTELHAPIIREKNEPRDGYEPVPVALIGVFAAVVFWGGYYLAANNGDFSGSYLDGDPRPVPGMAAGPVGPPDPLVLGKKLYTGNCVSCHQANGAGVPGQYPPLAGSEWVMGEPARLKRILLHGLEGAVRVGGVTYNGNMPPFGAKMKDAQIAAVLSYIRSEWGNSAAPVSGEAVAATRDATKSRAQPWTEPELLAITKPDYTEPPTSAPATGSPPTTAPTAVPPK